jgi:hypothetical protein
MHRDGQGQDPTPEDEYEVPEGGSERYAAAASHRLRAAEGQLTRAGGIAYPGGAVERQAVSGSALAYVQVAVDPDPTECRKRLPAL